MSRKSLLGVLGLVLTLALSACTPAEVAWWNAQAEVVPAESSGQTYTSTVDQIIQHHFGAAAPSARRIAQCESGLNPDAVSRTNDHGLFQINGVHRAEFERVTGHAWWRVYDADLNTRYAKHLYDNQGWGPWTCRHAA